MSVAVGAGVFVVEDVVVAVGAGVFVGEGVSVAVGAGVFVGGGVWVALGLPADCWPLVTSVTGASALTCNGVAVVVAVGGVLVGVGVVRVRNPALWARAAMMVRSMPRAMKMPTACSSQRMRVARHPLRFGGAGTVVGGGISDGGVMGCSVGVRRFVPWTGALFGPVQAAEGWFHLP